MASLSNQHQSDESGGAEDQAPRRTRRLFTRRLLMGALIACVSVCGIYIYSSRPFSPSTKSGAVAAAPAISVQAARALVQDLPITVTGLGTVQPLNSVTVKPRVSGQITELAFKEGQFVKAGDVVARLDPRPFLSPLHQAEANLAKDKAQLSSASADLNRTTALARKGWATGQTLDTQTAQQAGLAATIAADEAMVASAQLQLDFATVVSPIDGIAGIRMIDSGNVIATSDPGIVVINQLDPISVVFTVPSNTIAGWPVGQPASDVAVTVLSADASRTLGTGKLTLVDNHIDTNTGTIRLKATVPNPSGILKPGQFVNAQVENETVRQALTIPSGAVQHSTVGTFVYFVAADGTLAQRPIDVGPTVGTVAVVTKGLSPGDVVVTDGQYGLKAKMKVEPKIAVANSAIVAVANGLTE